MFHRTLLAPQLSPHSTPFPTLAPSPTTSPSLLCPSASPSTATLQGVLCFGRLNNPLSIFLRSHCQSSCVFDFTTVFSGVQKSKCYHLKCFWLSGAFKRGETHWGRPFTSIGKLVRDDGPFSRFEKSLSKGKRNRKIGECASFSNGKGKNSLRTEKTS